MLKKRVIVARMGEILSVFFKYGFAELVNRIKKSSRFPFRIKKPTHEVLEETIGKPFAVRIRLALEELGAAFIKFGQVLSMRPDILPQNIVLELAKLQDQVPPFPIAEVRQTVENQFGKPFSDVFPVFSETPEAAASIAQVHRAVLADGRVAAVKIRRPGVSEQVEVDLEILRGLAELAERSLPDMALLNPSGTIKEFQVNLQAELDFHKEGRNIESFRKYFRDDPAIHIPEVYWEYCTEKVLTMEFIQGIKVSDRERLVREGADLPLIARRGLEIVFKQIFRYGFFHADPHAGNIFILPDDAGTPAVIAPIDYGMVGFVNEFIQDRLGRALKCFAARDARGLVKVLGDLDLLDDGHVTRELAYDIEHLINYYYNVSLAQLNLGTVIMELIDIIRKHRIRVPCELVMLGKAISTAEALGKDLDPTIDIASIAEPYVTQLVLDEVNPMRKMKEAARFFSDANDLLRVLPDDIQTILRKIRTGKLTVKLEHEKLDTVIKDTDKSSNRLSFSVIIAAFLIGSSLITFTGRGPAILGVPVIGFIGYVLAGLLGIWLVIGIIRSGRL